MSVVDVKHEPDANVATQRGGGADRYAILTAPDSDINAHLEQLRLRQRHFERALAKQLEVDAAGLSTMDYLMSAGTATPTELSKRLEISTAAMTLVLDRLEAAGHVSRQPHPVDGRKVIVTPAPSSVGQAFQHVEPLINGVEELVESLSPDETATIRSFLRGVLAIYDEANRRIAG
jgi:DNA-binding MarR family transcriptional regulator